MVYDQLSNTSDAENSDLEKASIIRVAFTPLESCVPYLLQFEKASLLDLLSMSRVQAALAGWYRFF